MPDSQQPRPSVSFTVDFTISAKERPRMARNGHVYTPSKTRDCEKAIAIVALGARNAAGLFRPFRGDCHIKADIAGDRRSDLDNRQKLLADALNGILYEDDRQIVEWNVRLIAPQNVTTVTVTEIGNDPGERRKRVAGKRVGRVNGRVARVGNRRAVVSSGKPAEASKQPANASRVNRGASGISGRKG